MSEWRTIDSAPTDGTLIWVANSDRCWIAFMEQSWDWKRFRIRRQWIALFNPGYDRDDESTYPVTHWQPLPSPPHADTPSSTTSATAPSAPMAKAER